MNIDQTTQTVVSTICIGVCTCFLSKLASSGVCPETQFHRSLLDKQAVENSNYYTESAFTKLDGELTINRMRHFDVHTSVDRFVEYLLDNGSPLTADESRSINASIERLYKKTGRKVVL